MNPCGQHPMDFRSISLPIRTECRWSQVCPTKLIQLLQHNAKAIVALPAFCCILFTYTKGFDCTTPRGFQPLRAEPNGFRVHLLNHSDTVALTATLCNDIHANGLTPCSSRCCIACNLLHNVHLYDRILLQENDGISTPAGNTQLISGQSP